MPDKHLIWPEELQKYKDILEREREEFKKQLKREVNIIELLGFCLNNTHFLFQDQFYEQTKEAAMRSPVSPIVANIYMEAFEDRAISTALHPQGYGKGMLMIPL